MELARSAALYSLGDTLLQRRHTVRRRRSRGVALPSLGFLLLLALGALVGAVLLVDDGGVNLGDGQIQSQ